MAFNPANRAPGVYVEEIQLPGAVAGVGTSTAAFVGPFAAGPLNEPRRVTSIAEFERTFGGVVPTRLLIPADTEMPQRGMLAVHAVYGFFRNGGRNAYIVRIGRDSESAEAELEVVGSDATVTLTATAAGLWPTAYEVHVRHSVVGRYSLPQEQRRVEADATTITLESVEGIAQGSVLRVRQGAQQATGTVAEVDTESQQVILERAIGTAFDRADEDAARIQIERITFTIAFVSRISGDEVASFPERSLNAEDVLEVEGRQIRVEGGIGARALAATGDSPARFTGGDDIDDLTAAHYSAGIDLLRSRDDVNILCVPDAAQLDEIGTETVQQRMIDHCTNLEDRFAILDPRPGLDAEAIQNQRNNYGSDRGFAAIYYPQIRIGNPVVGGAPITVPPSGHLAGMYADVDTRMGVQRAPANLALRGVLGVERLLDDATQGPLNERQINVIRQLTGRGTVIRGGRTLATSTQWRYVNIRRLLIFIEQSVKRAVDISVFEPNTPGLRQRIVRNVRAFLLTQWQAGALVGRTPDEAFLVRADDDLNPPDRVALGILTVEVAVAPAPPAEFIVFRVINRPGGPVVEE